MAIDLNCNLFLLTSVLCSQHFNRCRLSPVEAKARLQLLGHMLAPERVPHPCAGNHSSCVRMVCLLTNPVTGSSWGPSPELGVSEHAVPRGAKAAPSPWSATPFKPPPQAVSLPPSSSNDESSSSDKEPQQLVRCKYADEGGLIDSVGGSPRQSRLHARSR
jgi:hypothetical protein